MRRAVAGHRHEWHHAGPATDQQERPAILNGPDEMPADGTTQFDLVANRRDIMEEGGYLAVVQPFDGELNCLATLGRRCDRIAALRLITIRCAQPYVDMLAR